MTLNRLTRIITELEFELKFGDLTEKDKERFKSAVCFLKLALNDRVGIPLYEMKTDLNSSQEFETNNK